MNDRDLAAATNDHAIDSHAEDAFKLARFSVKLGLPPGLEQQLQDATAAVGQEYRDGSRWKRLECRRVSIFAERDQGAIYVIDVGVSVEFDWTWEGASAFCPASLGEDAANVDHGHDEPGYQIAPDWSGEIVELDEQNGCLFISLDDPDMVPSVGMFFVRPFEFLAVVNAVYRRDEFDEVRKHLSPRLNAGEGDVHPPLFEPCPADTDTSGLSHLRRWWQHSWAVLWGPPGTGKTFTTGRQIASVLADPTERVLVMSTTNRATDAVAISIGQAAKTTCPELLEKAMILRIGKGASYRTFVAKELDPMLAGTESDVLSQLDKLKRQLQQTESPEGKALMRKQISEWRTSANDRSTHHFVDAQRRVVVATAFKAMSYLKDETIRKMIEQGQAPFTTVVIDEAGLISRAALAALSLLAARRVVLVGDSKQLAPISRISRVLPTRQQTWLASSGLSHLVDPQDIPEAVHLLSQQWRMHPDVCKVVSHYQYGGILTTAPDRIQNVGIGNRPGGQNSAEEEHSLSPWIAKQSRAIWYVLDEEDARLTSIRAARGPGNRSWVRGVTKTVLQKLFADADFRSANGLFISPFKAQAEQIGKLLASWQIRSWEASTVHSQQGSEADIVIFDTVNAGSGTWQIPEWKRLVNVALSRAREAIIVLASRREMDEPYLRPLKKSLASLYLAEQNDGLIWRESDRSTDSQTSRVAEPPVEYKKTSSCRIGDQFKDRKGMQPILSHEQQRLTNLKLDGKPRLVRGVAGSGKSIVLCNWLARTAKRMQDDKNARIWAVYANRSLHPLLQDSIESAWENLDNQDLLDHSEFPWEKVSLLHVKDVLEGILPNSQMSVESIGFDYDRVAEEFLNRHDVDELLPRCSALFIDEAQDMGPSTLRLLLSIVEQTDEDDTNSRPAHLFYDNAQNVYGTKTPNWTQFGLDMRGRSTIMRESFRSTAPIAELAVNVLSRLAEPEDHFEQQELFQLGLLESTRCGGEEWLRVHFNQINGPNPIYHSFQSRDREMTAIASHLKHLIVNDAVAPNDICILYNGRVQADLQSHLAPELAKLGVELSFQRNRSFERQPGTLLATTPHSFKGYESEVVVIPGVDHYVASEGKILAANLYVAMTRARSLLAIYGVDYGSNPSRRIGQTIADCIAIQNTQSTESARLF